MFKLTIMYYLICTVQGQEEVNPLPHPRAHHELDMMGRQDKEDMFKLSEDLLKDSMLKMRQIKEIREEHESMIAFNVGVIIGKIREKFRHMLEIYREIYDRKRMRTTIYVPAIMTLRPLHSIIALEMMHYLSVEIDKFIHVLETEAAHELKTDNIKIPDKNVMPSIGGIIKRTGKEEVPPSSSSEVSEEDKEIIGIAKEQAAKSLVRQQYLMRKLGRPLNLTTTRKRFMNQWPVEDTWSREEYAAGKR